MEDEKGAIHRNLKELEADLVAASPETIRLQQALAAKTAEVRALESAVQDIARTLKDTQAERDQYKVERDYARRFESRMKDCQEILSETSRRYETLRGKFISVVSSEDGLIPMLTHSVETAFRVQQAVAQFAGVGLRRIGNPMDRKFVQTFLHAMSESCSKVHGGIKEILQFCHHNAAEPELAAPPPEPFSTLPRSRSVSPEHRQSHCLVKSPTIWSPTSLF